MRCLRRTTLLRVSVNNPVAPLQAKVDSVLRSTRSLAANRQLFYRPRDVLNQSEELRTSLSELNNLVDSSTSTGNSSSVQPREYYNAQILQCSGFTSPSKEKNEQSASVGTQAVLRILKQMKRDGVVADGTTYSAAVQAILLHDLAAASSVKQQSAAHTPTSDATDGATTPSPDQRISDAALFLVGQALQQNCMTDDLWTDAMFSCAALRVPAALMDRWVDKLFECYASAQGENSSASHPSISTRGVPFDAVRNMISWAAQANDIERALGYLHRSKQFGIVFPDAVDEQTLPAATIAELCKLELHAKVLCSVKAIQFDGGVRDAMLQEIRSNTSRTTMEQHASWTTLNDLMSGLSFDSSMALVKRASRARGGDEHVPFFIWASLLRRAARQHLVSESESSFYFLRKRFTLVSEEKAELVEVMMRMYATFRYPDFTSVNGLFGTRAAASTK